MRTMLSQTLHSISIDHWHERALVRTADRIKFPCDYTFDTTFPVAMKPLLGHPLVAGLDRDKFRFLCVQYFYKYMQEICITETEVVNPVALAIANNASIREFSVESQTAAYSVMVDEAYHSFAACLFAASIAQSTGIPKTKTAAASRWQLALRAARNAVPKQLWPLAEFLACCVSESTFTSEILMASKIDDCDPKFRTLMRDHLSDEGRHCSFFKELLTLFWIGATGDEIAGSALIFPVLYTTLFNEEIDQKFDKYLLTCVGLRRGEIARIFADIGAQQAALGKEDRVVQSMTFLKGTGILGNAVVQRSFHEHGIAV